MVDRLAPGGRPGIGGFMIDVVKDPRDGVGVIQNQGHIRLVSDVASLASLASGAGPVHRHTAAVSRPAN
jgi:hypothetical protein